MELQDRVSLPTLVCQCARLSPVAYPASVQKTMVPDVRRRKVGSQGYEALYFVYSECHFDSFLTGARGFTFTDILLVMFV